MRCVCRSEILRENKEMEAGLLREIDRKRVHEREVARGYKLLQRGSSKFGSVLVQNLVR